MSDGDRGKYYSIGLGAALVISVAVGVMLWRDASTQEAGYQIEAQNRATNYAHAARKEAQDTCIAAKTTPLAECVAKGEDAARPDQREEYDLEAQRAMAVWTRAMGLAAVIGMAVGIFGVGLIFVTFQATRKAAEAGLEANRIADRNARLQLKAYVSIASPRIEHPTGSSLGFKFDITNSGQSPARRTQVSISVDIRDGGERSKLASTLHSIGDVPVGGREPVELIIPWDEKLFLLMRESRVKFDVEVEVSFETVFSEDGVQSECIKYWSAAGGGKRPRISAPLRKGTRVSGTVHHTFGGKGSERPSTANDDSRRHGK